MLVVQQIEFESLEVMEQVSQSIFVMGNLEGGASVLFLLMTMESNSQTSHPKEPGRDRSSTCLCSVKTVPVSLICSCAVSMRWHQVTWRNFGKEQLTHHPGWINERLKVLYTHTEDDYKEGYRRLKRVHQVDFVLQQDAGPTFKAWLHILNF